MRYGYFTEVIKNLETRRIRAFIGPQQSSPEHISSAFMVLMPEIFSILNENLDKICPDDQCIVIFGLQPASGMIQSSLPQEQNRFVKGLPPDYHLCCTLDFFKIQMDDMLNAKNCVENWTCTDSVIIDFTEGSVMDLDRFLSKINKLSEHGLLYGLITSANLQVAWSIYKLKRNKANRTTKKKSREFLCNPLSHIKDVA